MTRKIEKKAAHAFSYGMSADRFNKEHGHHWELYVIQHGPHINLSVMCWGYNMYAWDQQTLGLDGLQ